MLLVHIGPHKTATTYIQHNLFGNQAPLAERGWTYPEFGTFGMSGHHEIAHNADRYLTGDQAAPLAEVGAAAKAAGQNIVLSAEGFCRWGPPRFRRLAQVLGQDQVHLVYTLRDPFDVLYSYWAEEVKQGYIKSFADRFVENITTGTRSRLMNPMRDLAVHMADKSARISVMPYNVLISEGIDIYDHFSQAFLGVTDVPKMDSRPKNTALGIELTEFLRLMTTVHGKGSEHVGPTLRHEFMVATPRAEQTALADLVRTQGAAARRVISMDGGDLLKRRLEQVAVKGLEGLWSCPIEGKSIHRDGNQEFVHYDSFLLWQIPDIRAAVEAQFEKL